MAYRVIGTSPARADAWEKVRGRPIYAGDLALSGMLHGRIVRSPYPSARIVRLDTRAAAALPGVVAVLTARDVPRNELRMELPGRMAEATAGAVLATQPVLADARVRFQGEPVAAIAAETPEAAAAAADLVEVEYEELPGVYDPLAALAPDAPRVHDTGNLLRSWHLRSGGATRDGRLTALEAELISDSGAYAALSPWVLLYSLVTATGPYRIPHVKVEATTVYTNNPVASAYRCFGSIQTCLAYEGQMDALAAALSMDPLALREKNFLRKGDSLATGQVLETDPMLAETMRRAWAGLGERRPSRAPTRVGRAVAASFTPYGRMCWTRDSASAWVGMELDGTAVVRCAAPDVGGGQTSSLCAITAEILGLELEQVAAVGRDSHFTPRAGTTTATRQLLMSGNAVLNAARELRRHLVGAAAALLEAAPGDIVLAGGRALVRGAPDRALTLAAVVRAAIGEGRPVQVLEKYDAPSAPTIDPTTGQGKAFNDYTFGTHALEVEIDEETGRTSVSRLVACFDAGRVIQRASAEGQLEGGAVQGLGYALMEEIALDNGVSKNPHLADYKIPTSLDAPEITSVMLESGGS